MAKSTFRIYFVEHQGGAITGYLMRRMTGMFRPEPIVGHGADEQTVRDQLEAKVLEVQARGEQIDTYLWDEEFTTQVVRCDIRPATAVGKSWVVGSQTVPLRLTFAWSEMERGGFRVMLPRFDWWLVLEKLADAPEVLRQTLSSSLLGGDARWAFDFREQAREWVEPWRPKSVDREPTAWDFEASSTQYDTIETVAEDLVERGKALPTYVGDPGIGELLEMGRENSAKSAVLVGPSGAGKTARVFELAKRLERLERTGEGEVPHIWSTDADRIVAGMTYLGQWEKRCLEILEELRHEGHWLYMGRLEDFVAERSGGSSIADLWAPAIRDGSLSILAECTDEAFERARRESPTLISNLQPVRVSEASATQVPRMLEAYLERNGVEWSLHRDALRNIVRHLEIFEPATAFPGKAFVFVDWLVQDLGDSVTGVISPRGVTRAFSRKTGLPEELLSDELAAGTEQIAGRLTEAVIGQGHACTAAARVIARLKAGMNDPDKPCGSLFFVGPTGVGKTELAKQMARYMFGDQERLIRVDMSEFMTPGSSSRLLATGRGVQSLASRVRAQPLSLVLFDEIEKAHPEVFDLLLGVLGEGRLTDDRGRFVDFRMTVLVMTSNLGVEKAAAPGFGAHRSDDYAGEVRKHFRPEFFNRIDDVVTFDRLAMDDIERICDLMLDRIRRREGFERRGLRLRVADSARRRLAELGWHPERGARPLARVLEEQVVTPIAVELSEHPAAEGVVFRVERDGDAIDVSRG
jgi:ATP-dependent Clp protease ATP-binding subunit ClpC